MTDKVLYECPECGNVRLVEGPIDEPNAGRICQAGRGSELCLASMVQVWPAPSGWISVEGMPDDVGPCLVWVTFPKGNGGADWFRADRASGKWRWASSAAFWYGTPTHYQPGPSAPE